MTDSNHFAYVNDLDGDSRADLWVGLNGAWDARLSRGRQSDGSIAFEKVSVGLPAPDEYNVLGYLRGDFDGDGKLDAAANLKGNNDVYLGQGLVNGQLAFLHAYSNVALGSPQSSAALSRLVWAATTAMRSIVTAS